MSSEKKGYPYKDSYGDEFTVYPKLDMYDDNDNLYIGLDSFDEDLGGIDDYCDLTVNIYKLPYLCSCVNIEYGGEQHAKFLEEQGIAQFTGKWIPSGFLSFPVFRFNEDKLREIDPKMFAEYAQAHGREVEEKKPLDQQIRQAEARTTTTNAEKKTHNIEQDR